MPRTFSEHVQFAGLVLALYLAVFGPPFVIWSWADYRDCRPWGIPLDRLFATISPAVYCE